MTAHLSFAFGQLSLNRLKAVKNAYDATVNDVVVEICAGAVRRWLVDRDVPLVAQVPVPASVRTAEQVGTFGNCVLVLGVPLHTEIGDPVTRLGLTSDDLTVMKTRHQALPATLLTDVNQFFPPALFSRAAVEPAARRTRCGPPGLEPRRVQRSLPGPRTDLYCAGARLLAKYPFPHMADGSSDERE